jgi:adenylate cyclase
MKNAKFKKILTALLAAALITGVIRLTFGALDGMVSDAFYNRPVATDGEVIVIGMDQRALDELGPMPWPRYYMADVINYLDQDPDNMPAAIGIDVLFVGASADPEADAALAEACALGGNVIAASAATFGSQLVTSDDGFYMDTRAVLGFDAPFQDMLDNVRIGQINAMPDGDSIVRHALYSYEVPGFGAVKSFSRVIYETWCEFHGSTPNPEPKTTEGFFYLPYTASPGSYYEGISFIDLLNGEVEPEYFAGKMVLIGPYAFGMQDEYRTSISHASPMYGIEIQANEIDAFRNGKYPSEVSDMLQTVIMFVLCLAAVYIFLDAPVKRSVAIWLAACILWIGICFAAYKAETVLHVLWVPVAVTTAFIIGVAINYVRSQNEKRRISATFGRYVDPAIIKELMVEGSAAETLGGKNFDIAVLFVDIRGFTTMSESLPPATVVEIINKYLTLTTECIMRYHGTLDKFVGDCTMAFWNAPVAQEDPVYLACCAAMDMAEGAKPLAEELQERFGRSVSFGVGVHYGPAVVGNIGAPQRMDFTAIGDTVNTASRLESNAPAGTIYISRIVADMLGDRATTTSLGSTIKLKGKAEGFEVLTLDSLKR